MLSLLPLLHLLLLLPSPLPPPLSLTRLFRRWLPSETGFLTKRGLLTVRSFRYLTESICSVCWWSYNEKKEDEEGRTHY